MNTDEVDEVVRLMDLRFRTVYHNGQEIIYATREEAHRAKQKFLSMALLNCTPTT
ncbi:MAG: hypothetical protein IJS28_01950 [Synergistaceae bacterium]|nr:hypothetical protein [Synergistaceae bacterium]